MNAVKLIGLDFGTTTSSAVIASAQLLSNCVTGRTELSHINECYRSDIVFTPLCGDSLDETRVAAYLDAWLAAGGVRNEDIFGGGALLTGLTARKDNAAALVRLIRQRVGDALIASADDPCLEAWLAFMGSCAGLSREHPGTWFINLDIGGGTTNLAAGKNGEVLSTGCLFVGARHVELVPGTYRIVKLSAYARSLLGHLGIHKQPGDELGQHDVDAILGFYVRLLHAAVTGEARIFDEPVARLHQQVPFRPVYLSEAEEAKVVVTLSGGVGELVYAAVHGSPWPSTTHFGDLGIDLAERLLRFSPWADFFRKHTPTGGGRATVFGLLRHSTQVSGSTVFLPDPSILPLRDVPILGTITDSSPERHVRTILDLVQRSPRGGCVQIRTGKAGAATVRELATRTSQLLQTQGFPADHPLVVLVEDNIGKVLGQYLTQWGSLPLKLVVIDEIAVRDAHYVHVGGFQERVIPVSFYGLQA